MSEEITGETAEEMSEEMSGEMYGEMSGEMAGETAGEMTGEMAGEKYTSRSMHVTIVTFKVAIFAALHRFEAWHHATVDLDQKEKASGGDP